MVTFTDNSAKIIARIQNILSESIAETAEEVGDIAQSRAPVKTGELRDSKKVEIAYMVAWVGFTAKHAIPVEFGTVRTSANPFFTFAWMQAERILLGKLKSKKL